MYIVYKDYFLFFHSWYYSNRKQSSKHCKQWFKVVCYCTTYQYHFWRGCRK